jgi:hypothetical protein
MMAMPGETADTIPEPGATAATAVLPLLQVPPVVGQERKSISPSQVMLLAGVMAAGASVTIAGTVL